MSINLHAFFETYRIAQIKIAAINFAQRSSIRNLKLENMFAKMNMIVFRFPAFKQVQNHIFIAKTLKISKFLHNTIISSSI